MKKLILFLIFPACMYTQPQQQPTPKPEHEAEYYIPTRVFATKVNCEITVANKFGVECEAIPKFPTWAACLPNYHQERQVICTRNQQEPSTSRVVCHLNVARGYTHVCGLECTYNVRTEPQIIMPPTLDRQEASTVK